jgi:hypothetical protein
VIKTTDLDKVQPYPNEIIKLTTNVGFIAEFYEQCQNFENPIDAFDHVNELHFRFFKSYKYSDYHTFKNVRNRMTKAVLKK